LKDKREKMGETSQPMTYRDSERLHRLKLVGRSPDTYDESVLGKLENDVQALVEEHDEVRNAWVYRETEHVPSPGVVAVGMLVKGDYPSLHSKASSWLTILEPAEGQRIGLGYRIDH
jgi:hypothetical protein